MEFKESLRLKDEIGETVSAFSNSDGGTILVGVSDGGGVLGVDIGKNTMEELGNYVTNKEYQEINKTTKKTATRDLQELVRSGILIKSGRTGRGVYYRLNPA